MRKLEGCSLITFYILLVTGKLSAEFVYPNVFNDTKRDSVLFGQFPEDFMWGVASSAYQVEGAWNEGGRGESIWDSFTHNSDEIYRHDNGDIACDSYHNVDRDIRMLKEMGLTHYRLSISWSRLIPDGRSINKISIPGINYYNYLIDNLVEANIIPIVTLYNWDLPQALEKEGGWINNATLSAFLTYAVVCFQNFADRVPYWITFNEPYMFCVHGYGNGSLAPGTGDPGSGPYQCANNVIRAHALAYHTYDDHFRRRFNGKVGLNLNFDWYEPKNVLNISDVTAAETARQFLLGWFAHPIFLNGDYPDVMKTLIREQSLQQGYNISRLPEFTTEQKDRIIKTSDFFGISHYTTKLASVLMHPDDDIVTPSWSHDANLQESVNASWPKTNSLSNRVVPWGIRKALQWIKKEYNNPAILITGNGVDTSGAIDDQDRVNYIKAYTNEVLKAIEDDGVNVVGYTVWSLMDSFEWDFGYSLKYGLYRVDFSSDDRARTPRSSAQFYAQLVEENGFKSSACLITSSKKLTLLIITSIYLYHVLIDP
ncbi:cytosolic beta-glucosidase-like [Anneissia japonica]|uniref:cytosolic beta-glucosidase-like n=1 Tax=Anneissia japonica TaxID=1529436 RepID=UPI0014257D26|nr:cytosolic beta-glucosidase-like [Anneissia japonica]